MSNSGRGDPSRDPLLNSKDSARVREEETAFGSFSRPAFSEDGVEGLCRDARKVSAEQRHGPLRLEDVRERDSIRMPPGSFAFFLKNYLLF